MADLVATAEIDVDAAPERVWATLTDPQQIRQYMFGSVVETDWRPGSPISWKGEYEGTPYEDKGRVVTVEPGRLLVMTHFSPMSGLADEPENYHTLTYRLQSQAATTHVSLSQDNNADPEQARHSQENWAAMLVELKRVAESS